MPSNIITIILAYGLSAFSGIYALLVLIYAFFRAGPFWDKYTQALFLSSALTFILSLFLALASDQYSSNIPNSIYFFIASLVLWLVTSQLLGGKSALMFTATTFSVSAIIIVACFSFL